jgi:hypothetical protein
LIVGGLSERKPVSTFLSRSAVTRADSGSSGASSASGAFHTAFGPKKRLHAGASRRRRRVTWRRLAPLSRTPMRPAGHAASAVRPALLSGSARRVGRRASSAIERGVPSVVTSPPLRRIGVTRTRPSRRARRLTVTRSEASTSKR